MASEKRIRSLSGDGIREHLHSAKSQPVTSHHLSHKRNDRHHRLNPSQSLDHHNNSQIFHYRRRHDSSHHQPREEFQPIRESISRQHSLPAEPQNRQQHRHRTQHHSESEITAPIPATISTNNSSDDDNKKKPTSCCTWRCACRTFISVFVVLGAIMAIAGIVLVLRHRAIIIEKLAKEMQLVSGSATFEMFKTASTSKFAEILMKLYFFNLTNADDVILKGVKPRFSEIGPYVYTLGDQRENVGFNEDETEVTFTRRQFYYFDQEKSHNARESDILVSLDFVAYGGIAVAEKRGQEQMLESLLSQYNRTAPFRTYRVGELLWGSDDPLYSLLSTAAAAMDTSPRKKAFPKLFGLFYGKNGSETNNLTISTGKGDISQLQQIKAFNGIEKRFDDIWPTENITDYYNEQYDANVFRGVIGFGFPPDVTKYNKLTAFVPNMCFSIDMKYWTIDNIGDIEMLRFGTNIPAFYKISGELNKAMCSPEDRDDREKCVGHGVLNATKCFGTIPVILSWPHFFEADDYYLQLVDGLRPNEALHASFIDVDPLTGLAVRAAERAQFNFALRAMPFGDYGNLPKFTLFPAAWMERTGEITESGLNKLKDGIYDKFYALRTLSYSLLIVSVILVPISVFIFVVYQCRENGGFCFRKNKP